jgi:transposase
VNRELITHVGIDDFATKKGRKYGSMLVDLKSNRIIDMIETRDVEPVTEWLKSYPNIELVSRDGSIEYKKAIEAAHPAATHVSDRFHLLKNLTEYALEYLKKHLKTQIQIPSSIENAYINPVEISRDNENRKLTLSEKYERAEKLLK